MKLAIRKEIMDYLPKAPLDFDALIDERVPSAIYAGFRFPVLVMSGGASPRPARLIADYLVRRIASAFKAELPDAGHMAPITHADEVAAQVARHVENVPPSFRSGGGRHAAFYRSSQDFR
jgi:pimeloyl-ACP methyl ester carboxylesterase